MPDTFTASLSQYHVSDCRWIYDEKLHFWLIFIDTVKKNPAIIVDLKPTISSFLLSQSSVKKKSHHAEFTDGSTF